MSWKLCANVRVIAWVWKKGRSNVRPSREKGDDDDDEYSDDAEGEEDHEEKQRDDKERSEG